MKNKYIIILVILFSLIISIGFASACISYPKIEFKTECENYFGHDHTNEQEVLEKINFIQDECEISLTNEDIQILKEFVMKGYSVKEQTEEEYKTFLQEINKANRNKPNDCLTYEAASYKGNRWTGFVKTGKTFSETKGCSIMECAGANVNIVWNDLKEQIYLPLWMKIVGIIILLGVILLVVFKIRKN